MRTVRTLLVATVGGALMCAAVVAQEEADESTRALREAEASLEAARERLEEAAREVARLSAQHAGPMMRNVVVMRDGNVARPLLGLNIEDADKGVLVVGVAPDGAADGAGVSSGDVIVEINGEELGSRRERPTRQLRSELNRVEPGDTVALVVERDGATIEMDVVTSAMDPRVYAFRGFAGANAGVAPGMPVPFGPNLDVEMGDGPFFMNRPLMPAGPWASMQLVALTPELGAYFGTDEGLLLVRAPDDESLGLVDGDVILEIGGRTPRSPEHAMRILGSFERGEELELSIMRQQRRRAVSIDID